MKKTVRISIGGTVFNIDEDAYQKLQNYLNSIERRFGRHTDRKEIMEDIEMRIADLFSNYLNQTNQSIGNIEVNEVINIMGNPSDYSEEETDEQYHDGHNRTADKRMFRDPDNRILGGVCSGMGTFFNVDPIIFRIVFVASVLLYGSGSLVYIILWIIIPLAKTTADRLKMKGSPITISTIENNVKNEFKTVKRNIGL